jgi:hypothetical protein
MRWLIVAIFMFGLFALLASWDAHGVYTGGQRQMLGLTAVAAIIVVVVMVMTLV